MATRGKAGVGEVFMYRPCIWTPGCQGCAAQNSLDAVAKIDIGGRPLNPTTPHAHMFRFDNHPRPTGPATPLTDLNTNLSAPFPPVSDHHERNHRPTVRYPWHSGSFPRENCGEAAPHTRTEDLWWVRTLDMTWSIPQGRPN
jgi:hypothetical protein